MSRYWCCCRPRFAINQPTCQYFVTQAHVATIAAAAAAAACVAAVTKLCPCTELSLHPAVARRRSRSTDSVKIKTPARYWLITHHRHPTPQRSRIFTQFLSRHFCAFSLVDCAVWNTKMMMMMMINRFKFLIRIFRVNVCTTVQKWNDTGTKSTYCWLADCPVSSVSQNKGHAKFSVVTIYEEQRNSRCHFWGQKVKRSVVKVTNHNTLLEIWDTCECMNVNQKISNTLKLVALKTPPNLFRFKL